MNVIPFPISNGAAHPVELAPLAWIIVGLRHIGEPATSAEISDFIRCAPLARASLDPAAVEDVLAAYAQQPDAEGVFQQVCLRGSNAWGFTAEFRYALRCAGFRPVWRGK